MDTPRIKASLWFDTDAEAAVTFYCGLVPGSRIDAVTRYGPEGPGPEGDVLTVSFTLGGVPCVAINGGPRFPHTEAFSWVIECDTQDEIDHYWRELTADGGAESQCGWCRDRFGLSWQVVPRNLGELLAAPGAVTAMLGMTKLDIAALRAAGEAE